MRSLKILLVLFLVFVASSLVNQATVDSDKAKKGQLLGDRTKKAESTSTPTPSPFPTDSKHSSELETEEQPASDSQSIEYVYPGSKTVRVDGSSFYLESNDDPKLITDWYKGQIEKAGFGAKSSVSTNTNGNVLNKISAAGDSQSVDIEVKRGSGSSTAEIRVSVSSE